MKQIYVISFIFLKATSSYSIGIPGADFPKFQLGINFSPDITYRIYKSKNGNDGEALIQLLKDTENPKFGFTGGFNTCYNLNNRVGFEVGLQYSNKGYQTEKIPLNALGNKPTDPISVRNIYNLDYIDIPLKANLTLGSRKVRFFGSTGLVTNLFIQERTTQWLEYNDYTEIEKYNYSNNGHWNKVSFSVMISAGICWQLNEKFNLRIEPTYRRGISPSNNSIFNIIPCNAGLNFGLYVGL